MHPDPVAPVLIYAPSWDRYEGGLVAGEPVEFCEGFPRIDGVRHHGGPARVWVRAVEGHDRMACIGLRELVVTR